MWQAGTPTAWNRRPGERVGPPTAPRKVPAVSFFATRPETPSFGRQCGGAWERKPPHSLLSRLSNSAHPICPHGPLGGVSSDRITGRPRNKPGVRRPVAAASSPTSPPSASERRPPGRQPPTTNPRRPAPTPGALPSWGAACASCQRPPRRRTQPRPSRSARPPAPAIPWVEQPAGDQVQGGYLTDLQRQFHPPKVSYLSIEKVE
jgi:hypothetical protein